jgi:uncharacterized cupredoxin-like copper-binding protein
MKKLGLLVALVIVAGASFAQSAKTVKLSQTPGEFETKEITLKAGKPYVFEVTNNGVDHEIGFVLAPKGKTDQANHIGAAYLSKAVKDGESATSQEVTLEAGEYVYFCPLNPTPEYRLIVK